MSTWLPSECHDLFRKKLVLSVDCVAKPSCVRLLAEYNRQHRSQCACIRRPLKVLSVNECKRANSGNGVSQLFEDQITPLQRVWEERN